MMLEAIDAYGLWAPTYDSEINPLLALEQRTMQKALGQRRASQVVDIACGTGRWLLHHQKMGARVVGIDFCAEMLRQAELHSSLRGQLICGDAANVPIRDGTADLTLCSLSLGYFPDLRRAFRELARISVAGGRVAVSDMHPSALAAGWTRTFKEGVVLHQIRHYARTLDEIEDAARTEGLRLLKKQSAFFGEQERFLFKRAGKEHCFASVSRIPALFAYVWGKPC